MPNQAEDGMAIGDELDHNFRPLVHDKLGRQELYFGLFVCDRPLSELVPDGSNGRWIFIRFDKNMDGLAPLSKVIALIEQAASERNSDPVQSLIISLLNLRQIGKKLIDSLSISRSGISIKLSEIRNILKKDKFIVTNIYD